METVKSLRQKGYKVRVFHSRLVVESEEDEITTRRFNERGGSTEVQIFNDTGSWVTTGNAVCSDKENYDRKKGVRIALGRALDKMPFQL
jgi:hypothetical protein